MTDNDKAILRIVGELLKEEREAYTKTIKTMADLHATAMDELKEDFKTRISEIELKQGEAGKDGVDGKDGDTGEDGAVGADGTDGTPGLDGSDGAKGDTGETGEKGLDGIAGRDVLVGRDGVKGDSGVNGKDGKSPMHKGLYDEDEIYEAGDIVMFNDSSWFKTNDESQTLPGEGWKLTAKQGKTGRKGDRGDTRVIKTDSDEAIQTIHDEVGFLKEDIKRLQDDNRNK